MTAACATVSVGSSDVAAVRNLPLHIGQIGPIKVGIGEDCVEEIDARKITVLKISILELRCREVGVSEVGVANIGSFEENTREVHVAEIYTHQVGVVEYGVRTYQDVAGVQGRFAGPFMRRCRWTAREVNRGSTYHG